MVQLQLAELVRAQGYAMEEGLNLVPGLVRLVVLINFTSVADISCERVIKTPSKKLTFVGHTPTTRAQCRFN